PCPLILTHPTFLIPFCTWLMMGYFKAVPRELEECARIDGASRWQAMLYIVIPVAIPGILSAGIFAFTLSWNEFIYALVFLSSPEQKTVPVGVTSELIRGDVFFWGPLMAGALLGSIPGAIAYSLFVGPSGCGKTTTLRMIAGLEAISSGDISIDGNVVNDLAPMDRDIAMVFQNYALYPHMSVYDNMAFGLKMRKFEKPEINKRVREAADILGIGVLLK